jgi:hypothetical protein
VSEQPSRVFVVPPADAQRPIHELNEILSNHDASAPGFFTMPGGRHVWEVIVASETAELELAFLTKGWTLVERPDGNA